MNDCLFSAVRFATQGVPGGESDEDFAVATPKLVAVFDGVTIPAGLNSGCVHGTSWLVRSIAAHLVALSCSTRESLSECIHEAITRTVASHRGECDLSHPGTPSTTVTALRLRETEAEYFVLADSPLVLDQSGTIEVITDERVLESNKDKRAAVLHGSVTAEERMQHMAELSASQWPLRNVEGGYWLASTKPEAAQHACTGNVPLAGDDRLTRVALLTDGASAGVSDYQLTTWTGLLEQLHKIGPEEWINRVREIEHSDPNGVIYPRFKKHDDATALYAEFAELDRKVA